MSGHDPTYTEICEHITNTPGLLSALYDIGLLPETIRDEDARVRMLAVVMGWSAAMAQPADAAGAVVTDAMVTAALDSWYGDNAYSTMQDERDDMRAAIAAALAERGT